MAVYAIGDIQGCDIEFQQLLELLNFDSATDTLWLVGDLVNRGPGSLATLRRVKALGDAARVVLGNHDLHLLAVAHTDTRRIRSKDTLQSILAAPDRDELLHWLRHRPLLHHDAQLGYTMVHAGLAPQWTLNTAQQCATEVETVLRDDHAYRDLFEQMYGDQPDRWSPDLQGMARLRFSINCFTRMRYCRRDGSMDLKCKAAPDKAPAELTPWFRAPGRASRELRIVCGHWSALDYHDGDGVLSIDTGCVWGARLCAVRLDEPAPPTFIACHSSPLRPGQIVD